MWSFKSILVVFILFFIGCGYQFGAKRIFPGGATKIAIPTFKNKTYEAGIENAFTRALKYELLKSGYVQVVSEKEAEAVIYGTVSSFQAVVAGTTEKKFLSKRKPKLLGTAYNGTAQVEIIVKKKNKKKTLWSYSLSASESYGAGEEYLKNETNQREAIEELAERMMEEIHDRLFLNF